MIRAHCPTAHPSTGLVQMTEADVEVWVAGSRQGCTFRCPECDGIHTIEVQPLLASMLLAAGCRPDSSFLLDVG